MIFGDDFPRHDLDTITRPGAHLARTSRPALARLAGVATLPPAHSKMACCCARDSTLEPDSSRTRALASWARAP